MAGSIDDYALAYVFGAADTLGIAEAFVRPDELLKAVAEQLRKHLSAFDGEHFLDINSLATRFAGELEAGKVFDYVNDDWAGKYVKYRPGRYPKFRDQYLGNNRIHTLSSRVGARFYPDVFKNYVERDILSEEDGEESEVEVQREAPASDRIVTFSDNQITELTEQTDQVIAIVSAQNQIDNTPGIRELLLGQLRAGRELIRAGSFKLYLMELTLLDTLRFLAKRYEREAIGGLAAALITALMKHMGIDV